MIISVSRRTDIPAFYGDWFMNRLRAGTVLVRNPMNHRQVSRIPLTPDLVDCIVFWTKDPSSLIKHLPEIDSMGYRYYFQFTLTPYGQDLEPHMRDKDTLLSVFQDLSRRLGRSRMAWRYDPIVLNEKYTLEYHAQAFQTYCEALAPYACRCIISFVDMYAKLDKRYRQSLLREITADEIKALSAVISKTAKRYSLPVYTCSEKMDLSEYGILPGACIDREMVETACGYPIRCKPDHNLRADCHCIESIDLGVYNTCPHGCIYCYANYSGKSVAANVERHDPMGEMLITDPSSGLALEPDTVTPRKVKSLRDDVDQMRLF